MGWVVFRIRIFGIFGIGTMLGIVFTLAFDSSPIKGEGIWLCCLVVCPALWIDESWIMFFEHLCFHPKETFAKPTVIPA